MIKSILTILAVLLILFFGGMETRAAKAESNQQAIPEKVDEEISYVALPIETIFNTKNKDMLIRLNERNILASFNGIEYTEVRNFAQGKEWASHRDSATMDVA